MPTLHRHIFMQVLFASLAAVGLFVFVLLAGNAIRDVADELASGRLSVGLFLRLLALLIPYVVAYALPLGMLIGILVVLGRLSSQREITAMKAAGISLYQLSAPILILAFLGVILSALINFYYAPTARTTYKQLLANILRENPVQFIQPRVFIDDFPGYVFYAGGREGRELRDFWIWELDDEKRVSVFVRAERGSFDYDQERDVIVLTVKQVIAQKRNSDDPEAMGDVTQPMPMSGATSIILPLDKILGDSAVRRKLSMLTLGELIDLRQQKLVEEVDGMEGARAERIQVQMQIQQNFAQAFSVFSLAVLAIPLAIKASRKETLINIAIALVLAMGYYLMDEMISWLETSPDLRPDLLIWVPNIVYQTLGFTLLYRANNQ